jgi:hypothetical protein
MIEQAERDMGGLIESYSAAMPEDVDGLSSQERHHIYRMLSLRVKLDNDGITRTEGAVAIPKNGDHVNSGCR